MRRYVVDQVRGRLTDIGPQLCILVGPSILERKAAEKARKKPVEPQSVNAVIDTGARRSVITLKAAERRRLNQVNTTRLFVVGGGEIVGPVFSAQIVFPGNVLASWPNIELAGADLHHPHIEFLIGRDILRRWIVEYDGPSGQLTISEHD